MLKTRFAMHRSDLNPFNPPAFVVFFDLTIGQALPPTEHRTTASALWRVPTPKDLQKCRLIARKGIGENSRQMSWAKTTLGILNQSERLIIGAFAHS